MSNSHTRSSELQKTTKSIPDPRSAKDLCEQLHELVQVSDWNGDMTRKFISLITNPNKQFQLNSEQRDILVDIILKCPSESRSTVHLAIIAANFTAEKGLRTLDGIVSQISDFISEQLELTSGIQENLLKNKGDKLVLQFIEERIERKDAKQKSAKAKKDDHNKLNFLRNLLSLLLCQGEIEAIATRLNLILEVLASSSHYQHFVKIQTEQNEDIKYRVKAIAELLQLAKPTATEAERLLLFGTSSQLIAKWQAEEIIELKESLQNERGLRKQRDDRIQQTEQQCRELQEKLTNAEKYVEQTQAEIEHERELYKQLESSSQAEINQQKEATLSKLRNRLEHELIKLERCLDGDTDSFEENRQIGISIIKTIKEKLNEQ